MVESSESTIGASLWPFFLIALAVVTIWSISGVTVFFVFETWDVRGQFGDTFGAVNALFSGLAFAGLLYTVNLQRQELSLQRRELELTRIELQRTAAAQEASERALAKQAEALEIAAKLNALSSVIEHYEIKINSNGSASQKAEAQKCQLQYVEQLEDLLGNLRVA